MRLCGIGDRSIAQIATEREIPQKVVASFAKGSKRSSLSSVRRQRATYPVGLRCRALGVSRRGYYALAARGPRARARQDAQLAVGVRAAHGQGQRAYGRPRVHRGLGPGQAHLTPPASPARSTWPRYGSFHPA